MAVSSRSAEGRNSAGTQPDPVLCRGQGTGGQAVLGCALQVWNPVWGMGSSGGHPRGHGTTVWALCTPSPKSASLGVTFPASHKVPGGEVTTSRVLKPFWR